ncbi:MAG TPA: IclR family transcriptional regulator [Streptosporangiaceae bacterium]|nr:IclR family transcriptional regulator [Streptosporangiaceae bacterium]
MKTTPAAPDAQAESPAAGVKSARRVLDVLEFIASRPGGASFPVLAEQLKLPKSSLHSLLLTLTAGGWIYLDEPSRQYRLGLRLWQVAQNFVYVDSLAQMARNHLTAARDELNETVQLAVLDGIDNVYIAKVEADHPLRLVSRVGSRLPAYATGLGKVLLSGLEPAELRRRMAGTTITRFTERTITSLPVLEQRLAEIRANGYGEDEGEYTPGVYCVAVPVRGRDGALIAAMSCSIPSARMVGDGEHRDRLVQSLSKHATALSRDLVSPGSS